MTPAPAKTLTLLPESTPVLRFVYTSDLGPSALGSFSTSNSECRLRNHKSKVVLGNTHEACALVTVSLVRLVSGVMTLDFHPCKYTD